MRKLIDAWRIARLLLVPRAAVQVVNQHEAHLVAKFRSLYGEDPTSRDLGLMKLGFVATIEGLT